MKRRVFLISLVAVLLALPVAVHAQRPAITTVKLTDLSFDPHPLTVRQTEAGFLIGAEGLQGVATLECIEGDCSGLDGSELKIQEDLALRIVIDHAGAGFRASGRARGNVIEEIPKIGGNFSARVSGTAATVASAPWYQDSISLMQKGTLRSAADGSRIGTLQMSLEGRVVRDEQGWWLVPLEGDGTISLTSHDLGQG